MEFPDLSRPYEQFRADVVAYQEELRYAREFLEGSNITTHHNIVKDELIYRMQTLFLKGEERTYEDHVPETLRYQFRKLCLSNLLKAWGAKLIPRWKPSFTMEDGTVTKPIARTFNVISRFCPHHKIPSGQRHVYFMFPSQQNIHHSILNDCFYPR